MLNYTYKEKVYNANMTSTCKQYDTKIIYAFDVAGMKIKCKDRQKSLEFTGKGKILDVKLNFYKEIPIDANIYDSYDWEVKDGVLYVTLFEKRITENPKFLDILSKKMNKFSDEICVSLESKNDIKRR